MIKSTMQRHGISVHHDFHADFDDGVGAENFIKNRGDVRGVILISDGHMRNLGGFPLFVNLSAANLLPTNCALCSDINKTGFDMLSERFGFAEGRIAFFAKDSGMFPFQEMLPQMIAAADVEVGLEYEVQASEPLARPTKENHQELKI